MSIEFSPEGLIYSARERAIATIPNGMAAQDETVLLILLATALEESIRAREALNGHIEQTATERAEETANRATLTEVWEAELHAYQTREEVNIAKLNRSEKALRKALKRVTKLEAKNGHADDEQLEVLSALNKNLVQVNNEQAARIAKLEEKVSDLVYAGTEPMQPPMV